MTIQLDNPFRIANRRTTSSREAGLDIDVIRALRAMPVIGRDDTTINAGPVTMPGEYSAVRKDIVNEGPVAIDYIQNLVPYVAPIMATPQLDYSTILDRGNVTLKGKPYF
ncbi:MAG: hypothetical protein ABIA93_06720 [Candidatus Woesearchaeota archaeon]